MYILSVNSKKHQLVVKTINRLNNLNPLYFFKKVFEVQSAQAAVAKHYCEKWGTLKIYSLIALVTAAMFFTSCHKENIDGTVLNSTTSGSSSAQARRGWPFPHRGGGGSDNSPVTNYGAYIGVPEWEDGMDFQLKVADQLGISCLRERVSVPLQSAWGNVVPEL